MNHTNIDAELSAMAVATAFAFFASGEAQVLIRPDLALSQQFLNIQSTTRQLSTLARVLHVLGQSKPSGVDVQEVRAHRGDPWNELADAIARHVVVTGKEVGSVPWTGLNQNCNVSFYHQMGMDSTGNSLFSSDHAILARRCGVAADAIVKASSC